MIKKSNECYSLTVKEIEGYLLNQKKIPGNLYENAERKVLYYPYDGDGGTIPTTTPLCISSIISLMISPMGCGIHLTETGRGNLMNEGRTWLLRLSENDIVMGMHEKLVLSAVDEILSKTEEKVDGLLLVATCMDALLATNYNSIARKISEKYHIRVGVEYMGPLLKGSPGQAQFRMMSAVYGLLRKPKISVKEKMVNVFGILEQPLCRAELFQMLCSAGIESINCIGDFASLDQADIMTEACLNIVVNPSALRAANTFQDTWGVPYVNMGSSFDITDIKHNYELISSLLGCAIDFETEAYRVEKQIQKLKGMLEDMKCAVGGKNEIPCFKAACDLVGWGLNISTIFAHEVTYSDLPEIQKLAHISPNIKVYFDSHPSMYSYMADSDEFDVSFGVPDPFVENIDNIIVGPIMGNGGTFSDVLSLIEQLFDVLKSHENVRIAQHEIHKKNWHFL